MERRLAAILAADVVGYSRMMSGDESGTLAALNRLREELIDPQIATHSGRIVKLMGDGILAEFHSVVEAVACAVEVQRAIAQRNAEVPEDKRIQFRVGINLGDIIVEDGDIFGDGVNVAARLEALAEPGGICIRRSVRNQVRDKLPLAFEDMGEIEVKNIPRPLRVFRVVLDETAVSGDTAKRSSKAIVRQRPLAIVGFMAMVIIGAGAATWLIWPSEPWPVKPQATTVPQQDQQSIAVLPFTNLSGDSEQEYFADGITEDLITDLAKISGLMVIARNSTNAYKDKSHDVREVAKQLGVRYVVQGSVRRAGKRIRINTLLTDAQSGQHLWAERYDREAKDVFDLQDNVREHIVGALQVKLTPHEKDRLNRRLTTNAEAYDYYIRGTRHESFFTKASVTEAIRMFEKAVELDPKFAAATGRLATAHTVIAENNWSENKLETLKVAQSLAEKAVALDDDLPQVHWAVARVYSRSQLFDGKRAIASLRRAIALDNNYAEAHAMLANVLNIAGRPSEALGHIEKAMRLNPHFPFWYLYALGVSQFMLTRYEQAVENFQKALERNSNVPWPRRYLISAYGHLGRGDDAQWEIEELAAMGFKLSIDSARESENIADTDSMKQYLEGLRLAGVPEH